MLAFLRRYHCFYHLIEVPMHLILLKVLEQSKRPLHLVCRVNSAPLMERLIEIVVRLWLFGKLLSDICRNFPAETDGVRSIQLV